MSLGTSYNINWIKKYFYVDVKIPNALLGNKVH